MIGPNSSGRMRREQHDRPSRLAIADDCWLAVGFGMERDHALEESCLGVDNVFNRLAGYRIREETDEIAGMPRFEGDADFALRLEAADARAVPRTRIDNDEWSLVLVDLCAIRRAERARGRSSPAAAACARP